ncbi:PAS domain-containing protein [Pseudooctadecabacter sp.]|uniref:PAS domain-containing protein n=1 Tax=Pseudooctadecabacter sp. TaxID=1966338 RepID=UPI0035C7C688
MTDEVKIQLTALDAILGDLPYAVTLSDLTVPDCPLIYMNRKFKDMTGSTHRQLGQNCRYLQGDFDNYNTRLEIRRALFGEDRTQVILRNRRLNREPFFNMLMLETMGRIGVFSKLVLGVQFELPESEALHLLRDVEATQTWGIRNKDILDHALRLRLDQRRTVMD